MERSSEARRGLRGSKRFASKRRTTLLILMGAAILGAIVGVAPGLADTSSHAVYAEQLSGCRVTDGDTIRCGDERIRLLAIDAPELPGHCRKGRTCAPGDPVASTDNLREAMSGQLTIDRVDEDRYGRTLARVAGSKGDLSCWQLERGQAIYKRAWDNDGRVADTCLAATRTLMGDNGL